MASFLIDATWTSTEDASAFVQVQFQRAETRGAEPVWQVLGALQVSEPVRMTPKGVRAAALAWLAEHAGRTDADSVEIHMWSDLTKDQLGRLEAALAG